MSIVNTLHKIHKSEIEVRKNTPNVHFLTFANTSYAINTSRIVTEARFFDFRTIRSLTEHDIGDFIRKHDAFINQNTVGYGLWIWKPKIILDTLLDIRDGEILVYCDAGMHLNAEGLERYHYYIDILKTRDMVTFSTNDKYIAQSFVKSDAVHSYYPEFANTINNYCYAGVMMIKKTDATVLLIKDWLMLCETYNFLDRSPSVLPESMLFSGNDGDNGLFNLCLAKHAISHMVYPDETNIYDEAGYQIHNATPDKWKVLRHYPFQCRRLRPPR